ncbi:MAG: Tol-Pal system beta propeller repeat protein TolB [Alphaproteobacteria bacterium]|jgi:TolB protein|nr:Tol-Pal system beta propeller repeat protein TolB [Candidatus Jidaibacter sp.]
MKRIASFFLAAFLSANIANAALKIDINQGNVEPLPIAISDFYELDGSSSDVGSEIKKVVENDLASSGLFRPISSDAFLEKLTLEKKPTFNNWRQIGAMAFTSGKITKQGDKLTVEFRLWDPNIESQIEGTAFTLTEKSWRRVGHKIADQIYKRLTGETGYFDTRIVFISESGPYDARVKKLAIMDQDGANYKELTDGKSLVITPRFDPKSQRVIYMSYKNRVPQVYLLDLQTGEQRHIGNFPGMSFSPRFSPDGNKAVVSVAKDGSTEIYELHLNSGATVKLTSTPGAINTSPCYSHDGSKIVFNSDRGGRPQIYIMNSDGSNQHRISFSDATYFSPVWSPRGDFIAFTKKQGSQFYIGVMRTDGSSERLLTSSWMDEGPTWAPNGRVLMFSRQKQGAGYQIHSVDVTGYNERKVETPTDSSDPAWSPILG